MLLYFFMYLTLFIFLFSPIFISWIIKEYMDEVAALVRKSAAANKFAMATCVHTRIR